MCQTTNIINNIYFVHSKLTNIINNIYFLYSMLNLCCSLITDMKNLQNFIKTSEIM